jgi:hypothetical protein
MIKFLVIVSVIWAIFSIGGWVAFINMARKCNAYQLNNLINRLRGWSVALDFLTIAFWIWLVVR